MSIKLLNFCKRTFVAAIVVLGVAGCVWVEIDGTDFVAPGGEASYDVTHFWPIVEGSSSGDGGDDSEFFGAYILVALIPDSWQPRPGGEYNGEVDGEDVSVALSAIDGVPEDGDCDELPDGALQPGFKIQFFQTDDIPTLPDLVPDDFGTFSVAFTAGNDLGPKEIVFGLGLFVTDDVDVGCIRLDFGINWTTIVQSPNAVPANDTRWMFVLIALFSLVGVGSLARRPTA